VELHGDDVVGGGVTGLVWPRPTGGKLLPAAAAKMLVLVREIQVEALVCAVMAAAAERKPRPQAIPCSNQVVPFCRVVAENHAGVEGLVADMGGVVAVMMSPAHSGQRIFP
jgi:hypothetical protein